MSNEELQILIGSWFPNPDITNIQIEDTLESGEEIQEDQTVVNSSLLEFNKEDSQFLNITVKPEQLYALMQRLKGSPATNFDYLFCLSGVDWGAELGVVYHLESTEYRHSIVVKVNTVDRENPTLDSVYDIWMTAEFHEREVFDFFGIKFTNHPNLKRLFLTDEWDGYPLRKDYVDEINMVIK